MVIICVKTVFVKEQCVFLENFGLKSGYNFTFLFSENLGLDISSAMKSNNHRYCLVCSKNSMFGANIVNAACYFTY